MPEDMEGAVERPENLETIEVRVGTIPGKIHQVALNGGRTAGNALRGAFGENFSPEGGEIRVNGRIAAPDTEINAGDLVLTVQRIRGN